MGKAILLAIALAATAMAQHDEWKRLTDLGTAAEDGGAYETALGHYRDALRVAETFGPVDPRVVYSLNGIAMMSDALGRLADAESAFRRGLTAIEHSPHAVPVNRAMLLSNLASVYVETGRSAPAEKLLREAMAIHAAMAPPDPVRSAVVQNCLAELLTVDRRYAEAEPLLIAVIDALEKHAPLSTEIGVARNNLGMVRLGQGRFAEAQDLFERSLASLESARGSNHPILLRTLNNLAAVLHRNGHRRLAGDRWRRALDLAAASIGLEHPLYGELLSNYAHHLRLMGDKSNSKALAARSAEILRDNRRRNGLGLVVDVSTLQKAR